MDVQDLSEERVFQLLREAEERLNSSAQTMVVAPPQVSLSARDASISSSSTMPTPYVKTTAHGAQVDHEFLITSKDRKLASQPRSVENPIAAKAASQIEKKATAGSNWFNLPKTVITPELRRDLQLLRMRSVLDPKRHYKKDNSRKSEIPEFSQTGTIIEGPTEYFTARLSNKERKRTFVEDVLAGEKQSQRFKTKYNAIQAAKTSGKKDHYKALKAKRAKKSSKG